jgi:hypothetical protein
VKSTLRNILKNLIKVIAKFYLNSPVALDVENAVDDGAVLQLFVYAVA